MDRDTIWKALDELDSRSLIARSRSGARGQNHYRLTVPDGGNIPPTDATQMAENAAADGGNIPRQMAEKVRHECSEVNVQKNVCVKAHDTRPVEDHLEEIQTRWTYHDVRAAYRKALRHVRQKRGNDASLTVAWFEEEWMPREAEKPKASPARSAPAIVATTPGGDFHDSNLAAWKGKPKPSEESNGGLDLACWREANPTTEDAA